MSRWPSWPTWPTSIPTGATGALLAVPRFTCVPAAIDDVATDLGLPAAPALGPLCRYRTDAPPPERGLPAAWGDPAHPLVYVTFGSVAATVGPSAWVYAAAVEALADQPLRVLMTTGPGLDPASLGPLPANTHLEQWWPQHEVLPHAAAVVGHGGFGTTTAALASGVPQVVVPLFALDQFVNAAHVEAVGAGVRLVAMPPAEQPPVERLAGPSRRSCRRRPSGWSPGGWPTGWPSRSRSPRACRCSSVWPAPRTSRRGGP